MAILDQTSGNGRSGRNWTSTFNKGRNWTSMLMNRSLQSLFNRDSVSNNGGVLNRNQTIEPVQDVYERFVIREFVPSDYSRLREMNNDLFFVPLRHIYGPVGFLNEALKQQKRGKQRIKREDFFLAIVDRETSELIGSVLLHNLHKVQGQAEVAFFVDPSYQNIRIATDATISLIHRLGEELGVTKLYATVDPKNVPSKTVLARLGFTQIGGEFISTYKGNPADSNSYDKDGSLAFAPRIKFIVGYDHFLSQAEKVRHTWKTTRADVAKRNKVDVVQERRIAINEAREGRAKITSSRRSRNGARMFHIPGPRPGESPNAG